MKIYSVLSFILLASLLFSCDSISTDSINGTQQVESQKQKVDRFLIEEDGKFGYINHLGELVITPQFEKASTSFSEGLANVKVGGRWGFINEEGRFVINPQFEHSNNRVHNFSDGMAKVEFGGKWGYIDKEGKLVVTPQFDVADDFSEGLAVVLGKVYDYWGYIDKEGKYAINPQFNIAFSFSEGLAAVAIGDKWGFIDKEGRYVINPQFDYASNFDEGLAEVEIGGKYGIINKEGKYIINPQFDDYIYPYHTYEGLAAVKSGGKWGYINEEGIFIVDLQFDDASCFSEGLAAVKIGEKWGFIDKEGKYAINPQFDNAGDFSEGLAEVEIGGKWGYIDKDGKYLLNPLYDDTKGFSEGLASVKIADKWTYINKEGRYITDIWFDETGWFLDGIARIEYNGRWGYINKDGKLIWQSEDNLSKLYHKAQEKGYIANEEVFRSCINDSDKTRKSLYLELKSLGMKWDEAKFMEYIGYPISGQNKGGLKAESTGQTHTPFKSDTQNVNEQRAQWPTYSIPKACSITVPPTMELRDDNSSTGKLFSVINPSLYKLLCDGCDVFSDHSKIVFQPEGMNSDNPQDIDRATATYARIIIEFGYNYDVSQEDIKSMTTADLVEYDDAIGKQYKSEFDYAQQALGNAGSFVWHPTKREKIGGKYCMVLDYDRSGLQGMVKVKKYLFYYNGKEIDITCSYRISEKQKYEKDFEKVIRSIKFD